MPQLFKNNASATLSAGINDSAVSVSLTTGHGSRFPSVSGSDFFLATLIEIDGNGKESAWEIVKVTARSTDTLTVQRGQEGTAARSWPSNSRIELRITAGTMQGIVNISQIPRIDYDNRSQLRSGSYTDGSAAIVGGLGLFVFKSGSDEPDDDESCFAATGGAWLLELVNFELVEAWNTPETDLINTFIEDEQQRFDDKYEKKIIFGGVYCSVGNIYSASSVKFSGAVTGAKANSGDTVIVTPPSELGSTTQNTGRLGYYAYISADNEVTVVLTNASSALAGLNGAVNNKTWPVCIIKGGN